MTALRPSQACNCSADGLTVHLPYRRVWVGCLVGGDRVSFGIEPGCVHPEGQERARASESCQRSGGPHGQAGWLKPFALSRYSPAPWSLGASDATCPREGWGRWRC